MHKNSIIKSFRVVFIPAVVVILGFQNCGPEGDSGPQEETPVRRNVADETPDPTATPTAFPTSTPPPNCSAQTVNNCNLGTVGSGQISGSCVSGYIGSCSYSCSGGNWAALANSCMPQQQQVNAAKLTAPNPPDLTPDQRGQLCTSASVSITSFAQSSNWVSITGSLVARPDSATTLSPCGTVGFNISRGSSASASQACAYWERRQTNTITYDGAQTVTIQACSWCSTSTGKCGSGWGGYDVDWQLGTISY